MGPVPVALIEQVFRFFFPCWIEHGQLAYQVIAQPAAVCNRIAPLALQLQYDLVELFGIDDEALVSQHASRFENTFRGRPLTWSTGPLKSRPYKDIQSPSSDQCGRQVVGT